MQHEDGAQPFGGCHRVVLGEAENHRCDGDRRVPEPVGAVAPRGRSSAMSTMAPETCSQHRTPGLVSPTWVQSGSAVR
jgi:hypothetical protein